MSQTRKVVVSAFGDVSKLRIVTETMPAPTKNEVQVRIIYSGFCGADISMRMGRYPMQKGAPLTPGYCFAGRVAANGANSTKYKAGDMVTALTVYDSQSELINIDEKHLIPVPDGADLQKVCALTLDWNTAYAMVTHTAKVQSGQRVFVHGMSGAVGHALVVLCQLQGATVYGTASQRNHADLKALGAHPFVYSDKKWIDAMKKVGGAHVVFDPLGYDSFRESYEALSATEPSVLVGYGGNLPLLTGLERGSPYSSMVEMLAWNLKFWKTKTTKFYGISRTSNDFQPDLKALIALLQEGRIDVPIKVVFEMDNIREAHESWGKVAGMGSILVRVAEE